MRGGGQEAIGMFSEDSRFKNDALSINQMSAAGWNRTHKSACTCSNHSHSGQVGVDNRRIKY